MVSVFSAEEPIFSRLSALLSDITEPLPDTEELSAVFSVFVQPVAILRINARHIIMLIFLFII